MIPLIRTERGNRWKASLGPGECADRGLAFDVATSGFPPFLALKALGRERARLFGNRGSLLAADEAH